jgi:hypothetical protein
MRNIILVLFFFAAACSSQQKSETPQQPAPELKSSKTAVPTSPPTEEVATPQPKTPQTPTATPPRPPPQTPTPPPVVAHTEPVRPKTEIWKLQKGKLNGPFAFGHPTVLSKTKNKKGNGTTTETCYRYATYAVVEMKSSDEVGSAEISVRHDPPKGFNLCLPEFKGKTFYLKNMIEGHFAGVAGGMILIDGDDTSEGKTDFQLYDAETGDEKLKSAHHPTEEFAIVKTGDNMSVEFFAKLPVKCELAVDGEKCWKKVLSENKVVGKTPMPDCLAAYDKAKMEHTEPALVFTRARITKIGSPVKYLGGKATCQPEP